MIVPQQMAQAVRGQMQQFGRQAALSLPARGVDADDDIAEQVFPRRRGFALRKCQHIGRPVLGAPQPVEVVDGGIAAQSQGDIVIGAVIGERCRPDHTRHLPPKIPPNSRTYSDLGIDNKIERHGYLGAVRLYTDA